MVERTAIIIFTATRVSPWWGKKEVISMKKNLST